MNRCHSGGYLRQLIFGFFILLLMSGCSLLELSLETGVEPLPKRDLNSRLAVRAFYTEFSSMIISGSDSIVQNTEDLELKRTAIQWKMRSTTAATRSSFQTVPEIALLDTWILCQQMEGYFLTSDADSLFKESIVIPQEITKHLAWKINRVARAVYSVGEYRNRKQFVNNYVENHPCEELMFRRDNIMPGLVSHLGVSDSAYVATVGSGPEVMIDMTERIGAYNTQIQSQIEWSKDLLMLDTDVDSLSNEVFVRVDSLTYTINEFVDFAKTSPEAMQVLMDKMYTDWAPVVANLEGAVDKSFDEFAVERLLFEKFVDEQRQAVIVDLNQTSERIIETTTDNLIRFVRKISWVIILIILVLTSVIVGLPLFVGYTIAKLKYKNRKQKQKQK